MQRDNPTRDPGPPSGLVFFRSDASRSHRRRRQIFVGLYLLAGSAVLWPVYPQFATAEPRILGLPLSFTWVIGALLAGFAALLWFYLGDDDPRSADADATHSAMESNEETV